MTSRSKKASEKASSNNCTEEDRDKLHEIFNCVKTLQDEISYLKENVKNNEN